MAQKRFPILKPALEPLEVPAVSKTIYPPPHDKVVKGRSKRKLAPALGLKDFGVNLTTLMQGAASAMRHHHSNNDEFVYIVDGEATLITDAGEQTLSTGMCAGFPKGKKDGHHLVNKSDRPVLYLEVGTNNMPDLIHYPDARLWLYEDEKGRGTFSNKAPKLGKAKAAPKAKAKKKR
ncbi:MAG: cupin domain-containing protein [Rhodospirillaceae bacterium]|nr:cupin domain-containing protein [Rhodospirillaceae bacterium]